MIALPVFAIANVLVIAATLAAVPVADARITSVQINLVESPTFGGYLWPGVGQYEKIVGKALGEVDPFDPNNAVIVDIAWLRVTYAAAFFLCLFGQSTSCSGQWVGRLCYLMHSSCQRSIRVALSRKQLNELARHGAVARIAELEGEINSIRREFPDIGGSIVRSKSGGRRKWGRGAAVSKRGASRTNTPRRSSHMSAAARKAVSVRMKKYWAARRADKKKS